MHGVGEPYAVDHGDGQVRWYRTDCTDPSCDFHAMSSRANKSRQRVQVHADGANKIEES